MYGHSVDWGSSNPCTGQAPWYHLPIRQMGHGCMSHASGHCWPKYLDIREHKGRVTASEILTLIDETNNGFSILTHAERGTRNFAVVPYKPSLIQVRVDLHIDRPDLNLVVLNTVDYTARILAWSDIEKTAGRTDVFGEISLPNFNGAVNRG